MLHSIHRFALAIVVATTLSGTGCEETVDITDAAYIERLVVHGVLEADSVIAVSVTRTLPINEPFTFDRAAVRDAEVVVQEISPGGETSSIPLSHTQDGMYVAPSAGKPVDGYRYELTVRWNGRTVTASTILPLPVAIDSAYAVRVFPPYQYDNEPYFAVGATFRPRGGQIYVATTGFFTERTDQPVIDNTYGSAPVFRARDSNAAGFIEFIDSSRAISERERLAAFLLIYDPQYYEFYKTYYTYSGGDGPFSSGSDIVRWNIQGDGIGLFIGRRVVWRAVE